MTEQSDEITPETWGEATSRFLIECDDDLGARYAPQTKALRELARALDSAERYDTTLAAEYARMHRWLMNKTGSRQGAPADERGPDLLDMLENNPGARWDPNA